MITRTLNFLAMTTMLFTVPQTAAITTSSSVEASVCDEDNQVISPATIEQGDTVWICLRSANENMSIISSVQSLVFAQEETSQHGNNKRRRITSTVNAQSAVSKGGLVDSRHSTVSCNSSINLCVVETTLLDKFFNTFERISISGAAELEDVTRKVRGGSKISLPFELNLGVSI